jgi:hypothetical protein
MSPQLCFFASIAFGFIAWGDRRRPIHLAGTLRPARAEALRPLLVRVLVAA